ncbi:recombinase family protein [Siphonobacter sp. SORGH_AS_0500]|uniref:recombinase family protein n=1 Tax=Siphonobacter sp. SORGH_AS_0500 TaxID=1864824 RepID=UPI002865A66C|nr:recombinase family protein [Siphonobacter sp. SORGH_AS_0500]MDR6197241.1 DNA invertase Pin-like site-specific DNA recombinase [Siphonobacter sp. SORGH_AS_0500]
MKYICYYRVSTKGQGRSGLGLGDQRAIVERYLRETDSLVEEFTEIESGRKSERPQLQAAIRACHQHHAKLLIAKLDRLSRNVAFVMTLRDSGIDFVACDLPDANTLTVGMMVTFAQYEAERTSERTRAALAQKKAQGFSLGKPENLNMAAIVKGREIRTQNALTHKANVQATELAALYRNMGMTYAQIAEKLNQTHYQTRRQKAFEGKAVYRLLKRKMANEKPL